MANNIAETLSARNCGSDMEFIGRQLDVDGTTSPTTRSDPQPGTSILPS